MTGYRPLQETYPGHYCLLECRIKLRGDDRLHYMPVEVLQILTHGHAEVVIVSDPRRICRVVEVGELYETVPGRW